MKHLALAEFWDHYENLPLHIQKVADKNYKLLQANPRHPSLHFKKVSDEMWSARVGRQYRALAFEVPEGFAWFWIGIHDDYEAIIN